jgi:esterase FrsA
MPYTYPIETNAMFEDRAGQFVAFGVPPADVERMRSTITDMWVDGPGGWVYEWSALGAAYPAKGQHYLASLVYGCAKFPCLADQPRVVALAKQVEEYLAAAPTFPVQFERRVVTVPYAGAAVDVPVHLYSATGEYQSAPVLLMSAGVDTWKMDVHGMLLAATQHTGATVVAFDMPGTGEIAHVPLDADADEVILGLVAAARNWGNGKLGYIAFSFGGNFSAMAGLRGVVDAAVNDGGPIKDSLRRIISLVCPTACLTLSGMPSDLMPSQPSTHSWPPVPDCLGQNCWTSRPTAQCSSSMGLTTTSSRSPTRWCSKGGPLPKCT